MQKDIPDINCIIIQEGDDYYFKYKAFYYKAVINEGKLYLCELGEKYFGGENEKT